MTNRNRLSIGIGTLLTAATLLVISGGRALADESAAATGPTTSADWPQWRGPTRDGIVHGGPKLADSWPKEGPKLLWKSGAIPGGSKGAGGGSGSIVVSGGRAFVLASTKAVVKLIDDKDLSDLGWEEGIPEELPNTIDKEHTQANLRKWNKMKPEEWDAYVKEFMATLNPEWVKNFGPFIQKRMNLMKQGEFQMTHWNLLKGVVAMRGKKFTAFEELNNLIPEFGNVHSGAMGTARALLSQRCIGHTDLVVCLDAATGKELWRKEYPGQMWSSQHGEHGWYFNTWPASSTPAIWDDKCYVATSAGFYCLAVKDGQEVWHAKAGLASSSPLVFNGAVFAIDGEGDCSLVAHDASNGKLLWRQPKVNFTFSSPFSWACGGKNYLICYAGNGLFCIDPDNGAVVSQQGGWLAQGAYSTPALAGDVLFIIERHAAYKLTPSRLESLWSNNALQPTRGGSFVIYQDHAYGDGSCVDLKTGAVKWRGPCNESCTPVVADGKIFSNINDGGGWGAISGICMVRANPDKYEELGRVILHSDGFSTPAIANGKLFMRLLDCVACYDLTAIGN